MKTVDFIICGDCETVLMQKSGELMFDGEIWCRKCNKKAHVNIGCKSDLKLVFKTIEGVVTYG